MVAAELMVSVDRLRVLTLQQQAAEAQRPQLEVPEAGAAESEKTTSVVLVAKDIFILGNFPFKETTCVTKKLVLFAVSLHTAVVVSILKWS